MRKAYSLDLREKVMAYIASGGGKREASKVFNIGEDTIYRWIRRQKAGSLAAIKRTQYPCKLSSYELIKYVEENNDHTLTQMALALKVGRSTVFRWLKRLNITRKKRPRYISKEMTIKENYL